MVASAAFDRVRVEPLISVTKVSAGIVFATVVVIRSPTSKEPARIVAVGLALVTERPPLTLTGVPLPAPAVFGPTLKVPPSAPIVSLWTSDWVGGRLVGPAAATIFQAAAG